MLARTSQHGSGRAGLQPRRYKAFLIIPVSRACGTARGAGPTEGWSRDFGGAEAPPFRQPAKSIQTRREIQVRTPIWGIGLSTTGIITRVYGRFPLIRPIVLGTDLAGESTARGKVRSQLIVSSEEVFGLDAGLPDDRHEIGISRPAG